MTTTVPADSVSMISNNCFSTLCLGEPDMLFIMFWFGKIYLHCEVYCYIFRIVDRFSLYLVYIIYDMENSPYMSTLYIKYLYKILITKDRRILLINIPKSVSLLCFRTILQKYKYRSDLQSTRYDWPPSWKLLKFKLYCPCIPWPQKERHPY
jgi:hypothetical protein